MIRRALLCLLLALGVTSGTTRAVADEPNPIALTVTQGVDNPEITGDNQGFSVESADFAHGFLTESLLSHWLTTLGPEGVIRLGGYSMDLVWPAFGAATGTTAPDWAIGGTVDQGDLDNLKALLDATGWKVTLGAPLLSVLNGQVSMDQVVSEAKAASDTLGDDLLSVELGNEYDHVTTLTAAQYYDTMKQYQAAISAVVPGIKMTGPSANTATTNTRLDEFVTAVQADPSANPQHVISELSSHWYPTSHCGTSTTTVAALMSASTHTKTRTKLGGVMAIGARLHDTIPSVINESNSSSCSGMPGVSNSYATSLWSLDFLMQTAQSGVSRLQFHTNTAAVCGELQPRDSVNDPISYRYYGAFCGADQAALDADHLSAAPLYFGLWAFRQVPMGRFANVNLADTDLDRLRAYAVQGLAGELTTVLINVQDPASATATSDTVTLTLPLAYRTGRAVALASSSPGGLGSTDATGISLGGQTISTTGTASGVPAGTAVAVKGKSSTITVAPGTAQLVTFTE